LGSGIQPKVLPNQELEDFEMTSEAEEGVNQEEG